MERYNRDDLDAAANFRRDGDPGYRLAKAEYEGILEVRYHDMEPRMIDRSKLRYVLANTGRYVDSIARGGSDCLAEDTFFIDYDLRANLLGKVVYGERHCVDLSFRVDWVVREVKVVAYLYGGSGNLRKVHIPDDLRMILEEGMIRDLTKFVDMTGIYSRQVTIAEARRLIPVFQCGAYWQSKLTRLVKGCLIYLDHLENGTKTYMRADLKTLNYKAKELLAQVSFRNTAYVYTTENEDSAYNLILYAMCQEYPNPLFGGVEHVTIPADGDEIFLVGYAPMKHYHNVAVSSELVMSTLIKYSDQFFLEEELELAMIIACSLRQNMYLDVVDLPAVNSNCDLIYPALSGNVAGGGSREHTKLSKKSAVMLGRLHQMSCLVLFKDLDTSLRNNSDRYRTMTSLFSEYDLDRIGCTWDQTGPGILQMSKGMRWLGSLRDDAVARLRNHSVFEGFWLIKKNLINVLKDGMIKCLKQGVMKQNSIHIRIPAFDRIDSFDVLKEEVILGGCDSELKISDGGFNVSLAGIRKVENETRRIRSFSNKFTASLNFD